MQSLDERKMKILQAIIRNYLETGEPVGSRTIVPKRYSPLHYEDQISIHHLLFSAGLQWNTLYC